MLRLVGSAPVIRSRTFLVPISCRRVADGQDQAQLVVASQASAGEDVAQQSRHVLTPRNGARKESRQPGVALLNEGAQVPIGGGAAAGEEIDGRSESCVGAHATLFRACLHDIQRSCAI